MLHISFERARQSRLLSMLTHRAGGKGDAPHTWVPEHFEQVHMFWRAPFLMQCVEVLQTRMYCRSLRHACAFAADPSVDKEQSFIGGVRCFKRCPLQPAFQISQCRSLICRLLVQLCSVRSPLVSV